MINKKTGFIIACLFIIVIILTAVILNHKVNSLKKDSSINNIIYKKITFNQFAQSDCTEITNDELTEKCALLLGDLQLGNNRLISIKVTRQTNQDGNQQYGLYFNQNKVEFDSTYNLFSLEPVKYKNEVIDNELLYLVLKNDQDQYSTVLINSDGQILKKLTTNYSNYNYEIERLKDENLFMYYNTCNDNILKRHRLNLSDLSKDQVLYSEKILSCQ